ncbi:MAG: hypothetical protein Q7S29_04830 [Candidatus Peribacter sp.]|nr:hypothetical protein [Candidatus Peribacter sp.]
MDFRDKNILHIPSLQGLAAHHFHKGWNVLVILVFALVFVVVFSMIVPYNMDEFLYYDTILCHRFPGNNFHGNCDPFQLKILGTSLIAPLRSYDYVGSFPALYFLPIVLLWSSPLAARLLGMVFLIAGGFLAARAFSFKPKYVVPALILTFPYLFQHLVDTGPIGVQIFFVFLLYVLLDRWCTTQRWRTIGAITLVTFLGIWTKPTFFWFAPGLAIFLLVHVVRHRQKLRMPVHRRVFLRQGAAALAVLFGLLVLLFLSSAPDDPAVRPFFQQLMNSQSYSFSEFVRGAWLTSPSLYAFLHPLEATQRIYAVLPETALSRLFSIVHYFTVPVVLLALAVFARKFPRRTLILPAALYVSFLLTIMMVIRTKDSWAMHHAILSYPFLILSILATIRCALDANLSIHRRWIHVMLLAWGTAFVELNITFFALFPTQTYQVHTTPEKLMVQRIINTGSIPGRTIVLTLDWGMFYYSGLFGSSQKSVLFEWGLDDPHRVEYLQNLAREHNRKLVMLSTPRETSVNVPLLKWLMKMEPCSATPPGSDWTVYFEPDDEIRATCDRYAAAKAQPSLVRRLLLQASLTR